MNDALPPLPEYEPRADLWARIEADLLRSAEAPEKPLNRAVQSLPTHEPKADLWIAIERQLDKTVVRPLWSSSSQHWLGTSVAAAAVVVLVGIWWYLLRPADAETVRIEYATESVTTSESDKLTKTATVDKVDEAFIARQCAEQKRVCQRPEVHELRNQLVELATEKQRIEQERQVFGDDPDLLRAQVKVENQRAEIVKELITILRS
ncbi:hypothetical protein [Spirosoma sp.]|uniref:hypothetical protein n=1 Tax=Spirosoma sp. TaxID=1899569 RepID=UPI003B3B80F1